MNQHEMIFDLRDLAVRMIKLGTEMDFYGGFDNELAARGRELVGAGRIAADWADFWEAEIAP